MRGGAWLILALLVVTLAGVLWFIAPRWLGQRTVASATSSLDPGGIPARPLSANGSVEGHQATIATEVVRPLAVKRVIHAMSPAM